MKTIITLLVEGIAVIFNTIFWKDFIKIENTFADTNTPSVASVHIKVYLHKHLIIHENNCSLHLCNI